MREAELNHLGVNMRASATVLLVGIVVTGLAAGGEQQADVQISPNERGREQRELSLPSNHYVDCRDSHRRRLQCTGEPVALSPDEMRRRFPDAPHGRTVRNSDGSYTAYYLQGKPDSAKYCYHEYFHCRCGLGHLPMADLFGERVLTEDMVEPNPNDFTYESPDCGAG